MEMIYTSVDYPVGIRKGLQQTNKTGDQEKIMDLLNQVPYEFGGGKRPEGARMFRAPVNGYCAPDLHSAILEFQKKYASNGTGIYADGVVDPKGNTIRLMSELANGKIPVYRPDQSDHNLGKVVTTDFRVRFVAERAIPLAPTSLRLCACTFEFTNGKGGSSFYGLSGIAGRLGGFPFQKSWTSTWAGFRTAEPGDLRAFVGRATLLQSVAVVVSGHLFTFHAKLSKQTQRIALALMGPGLAPGGSGSLLEGDLILLR